ncbi:MAG: TonB-dependent receptor [Ignavibacteriae bacterium]|nr:TonB-dependent receptor [Ignavibacteriota bacterium]
MKKLTFFKNSLFLLMVIPTFLYSNGKLKGIVSDSLSNETLVGANIILDGTSLGAATDIEGQYYITSIPAGIYKLKCSYIGYEPKEISITIIDDKTLEINFSLIYMSVEGEQVVVTAQALGQAAAINQQLTSNTIVNVISEQKIKELPDANAAEALGRLPGVSIVRSGGEASKIVLRGLNQNLTTITLDGIKLSPTDADSRGIDLSTISQGSLSGIVLSKAITSDMEAEAIAGNVNFVTKTAPEIREIQVDAFGSYGSIDDTYNQYNFLGRYGERFFDNLLGVQAFGNLEKRNRSSENYGIGYDFYNNRSTYQIQNFSLTYTPETRKRFGGKILLDFRTPDNGIIKLNADYNRTERRFSTISRNYPVTGADVGYDFFGADINTDIKNISLQGQNNLFNWQINWNFSFSESNSETPYSNTMHLNEVNSSSNGVPISGMEFVPNDLRQTTSYEDLIPFAINNFGLAYFNRTEARTSENLDNEKTFFVDLKNDYNFLDMSGEVKFGVKYRSKYHKRNSTLTQARYYLGLGFYNSILLPDGTYKQKELSKYGYDNLQMLSGLILLPNFINDKTRDIYGKYLLNPMIDVERARAWYEMNINGINPITHVHEYIPDHSEDGTNYNLNEDVASGYLMNTLNFGTIATLITGLRIESDNNTYNALYSPYILTEWSTFTDTTKNHAEAILLPNIHLILKPTDYLNVRFAAFRGLERPNFNFRLPTYVIGNQGSAFDDKAFVILGNTNLKNAEAWNFEVNTQLFSNTIGLFSVSAFYKKIKNEVHQLWHTPIINKATSDSLGIKFINDTPPFSGSPYSLIYPYNSSKPTSVWGFEVEHQANLRYLPGLLSNIVLSYNFSIIRTETYTPSIKTEEYLVQLPGQPFPTKRTRIIYYEKKTRITDSPDIFGNVSLGYDIGGFSGRISYFYQGEFYNGFSADGLSNNIQKQFGRLDLSLKQEIINNLSIGLNVNNLTNVKEGTFLEDIIYGYTLDASSYRYGTTADLWFRITM